MDEITSIIAANLQSIRKEKQMTLQDLATATGVSKSMLGEIERGSSNPTITVLWKISTGLKVSISRLIHDQKPQCRLVHEAEWRVLRPDPGNISLIFTSDQLRNFEIYHMEFSPKAGYKSPSHERGVIEYMFVYEGEFTITVNKEVFTLRQGDSFFFEADKPHSYFNKGQETAKAYSMIYYQHM